MLAVTRSAILIYDSSHGKETTMDLQAQITRVRELMQQRANIDKELAGYKELADILKPKVTRKKRKAKTEQPAMKM